MDYTLENGVLVVTMPERISENNAVEVKTELGLLVQNNRNAEFVVDCSKLKKISPAAGCVDF